MVNGPESDVHDSLAIGLAAVTKEDVQFIKVSDAGHRGGEPALHGLDGPLGIGLLVAAAGHAEERLEDVVTGQRGVPRVELAVTPLKDQRSNSFGVVPPDLLGHGGKELEGRDHPFEDGLGALEGQCDHERGVGVGPGGDEEGDGPAAVGEVDVDVAEVGLEATGQGGARGGRRSPEIVAGASAT